MDFMVLDGVAKGFNQGVQNLARIKQAGLQLQMEREKFDIDKKISNLQLQKYEQELDPEIFEAKKKVLSIQSKMTDLQFDEAQLKHKEAEKRAKMDVNDVMTSMNTLKAQNPDIDFTWDPTKGMTFTTKKSASGNISFPQDIQIRSKISDMLLNEGKDPSEANIQERYKQMYSGYTGGAGGIPGSPGAAIPGGYKEVAQDQLETTAQLADGRQIGLTKDKRRAVRDPESGKWLTK